MTDPSRPVVHAGLRVPGLTPRILTAAIGFSAALTLMPEPYAAVAAALAVLGAVVPTSLATWGTALMIGLAQLARTPDVADWRPYAVLAVVHLLHVIGAMTLVVEPLGTLQVRAFARPVRRWLVIQVPAQAVLAVVLLVSGSVGERSASTPVGLLAGIVAVATAVAVGAAALLVVRRR